MSASRVTIASSSEDSFSAERMPVLIAVPRPRLIVCCDDRQVHVAGVLADHLGGAVGGAVVDDDHAGAELARHRCQVGEQLGDVLRLVVGRE